MSNLSTFYLERLLARAQVWLATVTLFGFLGCLYILFFNHQQMSAQDIGILSALTGVLGTIATQQNGYFFQRQRPTLPTDQTNGAINAKDSTVIATVGAEPKS